MMIYLHMKTNSSVFWFNIVFAIIHIVFYSLSFLYLSLHQCIIPLSVKMCLFFYIVCLFHQYHYKFHTDYILQWYVHTFRVILLASGFVSPMLYFDACIHGFLSLFKKKKTLFCTIFFIKKIVL